MDEYDDFGPPLLGAVGEALDRLHVALGHAKLYGYDHDRTLGTMRETLELLGVVLAERGSLELITQPDGLYWDGSPARLESDDHPGLGRLLHREGIAALSFEAGLPLEELARLLGVLRINLSLPENEEETLDSLLWQAAFTHIGYRAVHSLAEAEALSGRLDGEASSDGPGEEIVDALLAGPDGGDFNDRPRRLSEDAVTRAVADSQLGDLAPQAEDVLRDLPDRDWQRLFSQESEDREALAKIRAALEQEKPGDLATEVFYVLMQGAAEGRPELHTPRALDMGTRLLNHLADRSELRALGRILSERARFSAEIRRSGAPSHEHVSRFLRGALDTNTLVRVLLRISPDPDLDHPGLDELVRALPDEALAALVQAAVDDPHEERRNTIFASMGRVAKNRVEQFVLSTDIMSAERVHAITVLLRALASERGRAGRRKLLAHPAARVRAAAAAWYEDNLPDADVDALLEALLDHDRQVRRAAIKAAAIHRPFRALAFFRKVFAVELDRLDPERRKEMCVACARICGDRSMELLAPLFEAESGGRGRDRTGSSLEAAAFGLASLGSVQALTILRKGAGSWNRARKSACTAALASVGQSR